MSKLSDRIRKVNRVEPAPLGFAAVARKQEPNMLCVVSLSGGDAGKLAEALEEGADAVIVDNPDATRLKDKAGQGIIGGRLPSATRDQVAALRGAGVDFVVLDPASSLAEALVEESIGFVLSLPDAPADTTLRLIGDLGLDALIVSSPPETLTIEGLLSFRRVAALTRLPLLMPVSPDIDSSRLQALRDSGVVGVVIEASALGKLGKLRETMAGLQQPGHKRKEKADVTISAGAVTGHSHDEDDDFDDD